MRWTHLAALFSAALFVACSATVCLAETPDFSGSRPQAMQMFQGRLFSGQGWWNRYGEPVNAAQLAQAEMVPADKAAPEAATPMNGYGGYGDGYIYTPGACDCSPPCIWHLWAGYIQIPKRCYPYGHHGRRNCNDGCNSYSAFGSSGGGCGCGSGCGMLAGIFGQGGCNSCSSAASCGCSTPVTCTTAAADCGCKPVCGKCRSCHLSNKWRCFMAHWNGGCDSCSAPVSCGCATPAASDQSPEKQAAQRVPTPLPEEALLHPLPRLN